MINGVFVHRLFFFEICRSAAKTGMIAEWLAAPRLMRAIGAGYSTKSEKSYFKPVILKQEFDGLVYFPTTTRARPNPSVKNVDQGSKN
jgi:erythromycin esterase